MAIIRIQMTPENIKNDQVGRKKAFDLDKVAKQRLKCLKIMSVLTILSLISNIFIYLHYKN